MADDTADVAVVAFYGAADFLLGPKFGAEDNEGVAGTTDVIRKARSRGSRFLGRGRGSVFFSRGGGGRVVDEGPRVAGFDLGVLAERLSEKYETCVQRNGEDISRGERCGTLGPVICL
jgi:hypothetical protein